MPQLRRNNILKAFKEGNYLTIIYLTKAGKVTEKKITWLGIAHKKYLRKGVLDTEGTPYKRRVSPSAAVWLQDVSLAGRKRDQARKYNQRLRAFARNQKRKTMVLSIDLLSTAAILRLIQNHFTPADGLLVQVAGRTRTLNARNWRAIISYIENDMVQVEDMTESDKEFAADIVAQTEIKIQKSPYANTKPQGAFFPFYNNTNIDLKQFGIYPNRKECNYSTSCLMKAVMASPIHWKFETFNLQLRLLQKHVPLIAMEKVARILRCNIEVKKYGQTRLEKYPKKNKYNRTLKLGLIAGHYFIRKEIFITGYAMKNYFKIRGMKDYHLIYDKNFKRKKSRASTQSFRLISYFYENQKRYLTKIPQKDLWNSQFYNEVEEEICDLHYDEINCLDENVVPKKPKNKKTLPVYYADFETDPTGKRHIPFLCVVRHEGKNTTYWEKENYECGERLLKNLKEDCLILFHNAGYDIRFLLKYFYGNIQYIPQGRGCCLLKGKVLNFQKKLINVTIHDSWKKIPTALGNFAQWFDLLDEKEVVPYNLYTPENRKKIWIDIEEGKRVLRLQAGITEEHIEQFEKNIDKWFLRDGKRFQCMRYVQKYCERDVEVLQQGYEKWRGFMNKITTIDINNTLTLASLANKFFTKTGCFEGCFKLAGTPRHCIQKSIVGGRVMSGFNRRSHKKEIYNDYDCTSLYPSAEFRLAEEHGGFLKGKPKVIENLNIEWLKQNADGYFVEIKVTKIPIKRAFPVLSKMNKKGRGFSNDPEFLGKIVVDRFTLEDAIKYQKIEFEILRGYYYDEGRNPKIGQEISHIFNERLKMKAIKNPSQVAYKGLMNMGYGSMCMKPHETEVKVKRQGAEEYVWRNYNYIKEYTQVKGSEMLIIKEYSPIDDHFNNVHLASEILGMSKRIMNEVMYLAEDNDIEIAYQDTDSIHLPNKDISKLEALFLKEFGRSLRGKKFGEFHSDLELEGCKDVVSVENYFVGKKNYYHRLRGTNKKTGEYEYGNHIRMKGVPTRCVEWFGKENKMDIVEIYKELYNSKTLKFDLTKSSNGRSKLPFEFHNDFTIGMKEDFTRRVTATALPCMG